MVDICWEPDIERLPAQGLQDLQVERLRNTVAQAAKSPFYGDHLRQHGITAEGVRNIEDLQSIPFTTKEDLRGHFPYGLLCVPQQAVKRLHCSSGTTGNPTVIFHTQHDLDSWANLVARSLYATGVRDTDVFQNICGYGLFTGGLGFQYGAERLGALVIPAAAGNSKRQIKLIQDFSTTVIHTIPSYLTRLHSVFDDMGLDPRDTALRLLMIGAEPHSEETRQRIQGLFGVQAFNSYGLSEMNGPGVAFECHLQNGLHIWEDAYIVEIVDSETLAPVREGEVGELVLTTLDREAMPILRYRTRDLTRFLPGTCDCGRTHRRLDRITGRSDDMFIIRGCNVFPIQVEKVLMRIPQVGHDYLILLQTLDGVDVLSIQVEVHREWFTGDIAALDKLRRKITADVRDEVLVTPRVELVEPGALPKPEGKAVRVKDLRTTEGD
ncbi:MAG: phenylacetate--CoA ligase [Lentisphaerae bacterium]|jgi:phenylacetate-CoA ligase|nr:phenylacetate--CoA ligase [Lentisphaerota bacterium]MBT4822631.1 phenylacetate--CoA ligase [Lentisphaerota bacterium]MBT5610295.1 phenylacetate--CoA ligase [Lentisphaerota bacterium]MBT7056414.1 phenylacetate--CoA ligase [Lentisphaerota bacterium]MBT7848214.1 phenylacetate--CoA ligase [Lentisphaerota bacterium]